MDQQRCADSIWGRSFRLAVQGLAKALYNSQNNPPTLEGVAARAAARGPLPRGAQEGNEAASLHPLDLVLEACAT